MALNIVAKRKYSLKGFAEGWDDAYIMVRAANERMRGKYEAKVSELRTQMDEAMKTEQDDSKLRALATELDNTIEKMARELAADLIEGGKVVTTGDDGSTELVSFGKDDVSVVLDSMSFSWVNDLVQVAIGTDRLKEKL